MTTPNYDLFTCSGCESKFRVIWPEPLPSHCHLCSKIKIECPECRKVVDIYVYLLDKIAQTPDTSVPTVRVESISPRDANPNPDARIEYLREIFRNRAAHFSKQFGR
jgi:hypothetical protein